MELKIKKMIMPLITLFFFFSSQIISQEKDISNVEKKVNYSDLSYNNGLYYYKNDLYSGSFYNIYSSDGPYGLLNDSYSEGEIRKGRREGKWNWYVDNSLENSVEYKDGIIIEQIDQDVFYRDNEGKFFQIIDGKKVYLF